MAAWSRTWSPFPVGVAFCAFPPPPPTASALQTFLNRHDLGTSKRMRAEIVVHANENTTRDGACCKGAQQVWPKRVYLLRQK